MSEPKKEIVRITLPPRPVAVAGPRPVPAVPRVVREGQAAAPRPNASAPPPPVPRPASPLAAPVGAISPSVPAPVVPAAPAAPLAVPRPASPLAGASPRPPAPVAVPRPMVQQPVSSEARIEVAPPGVSVPRPVPIPLTKNGTAIMDLRPEPPHAPVAVVSAAPRPMASTVRIDKTPPVRALAVAGAEEDEPESASGIPVWASYAVFTCALAAFGVQIWMFVASAD